jgi:hypothetical protein
MTHHTLSVLAIGALLCGSASPALAQVPQRSPLARGDVVGLLGWQNVKQSSVGDDSGNGNGNDWHNGGVYGGGTFGWYWTDNHKIELEVGASDRNRFTTYETLFIDNATAYARSVYTFSTRRVAIGEQYQFFRNEWFHPHVAAGVDLTWQTTTETAEPLIAFGPSGLNPSVVGVSRLIRPGAVHGPDTNLRVRPFGEVGFKAYMTPRGFFRGDLRMMAGSGIDEVQMRFGFGVDF